MKSPQRLLRCPNGILDMAVEVLINEIWKLGLWDTLYIAMVDDFILFVKAGPLLVALLFCFVAVYLFFGGRNRGK